VQLGPRHDPVQQPSLVATKALLRASERLGLAQKDIALLVGLSPATLSRLVAGSRALDLSGKEGELALIFLRVYRSLDTLVGGDEAQARAWIRAHNRHLGGVPLELMQRIEGMVHVAQYLDAMRGKV
jgi:transcriptional regulator with XRE-family HTH domain